MSTIALPKLTRTVSGSRAVDAVVTAKTVTPATPALTTPAPAPLPQLPKEPAKPLAVDMVVDHNVDTVSGRLVNGNLGNWFLLRGQTDGKNGVYKHMGANTPLALVTSLNVEGTRVTPNWDDIYVYKNGKWILENGVESTPAKIMSAPTPEPAAPMLTTYKGPTVLTSIGDPKLPANNTGFATPPIIATTTASKTASLPATTLPEVDIVASPLTATGMEIKPIYIIGAIIVLIVGYYLFKKWQ